MPKDKVPASRRARRTPNVLKDFLPPGIYGAMVTEVTPGAVVLEVLDDPHRGHKVTVPLRLTCPLPAPDGKLYAGLVMELD